MRRRALLVTAAACTLLVGCAKDTIPTVSLYDHAPVPAVPDRTDTVTGTPQSGQYWATSATAKGGMLVFALAQAFFGPTCTKELGAASCANDYGITGAGAAEVAVAPAGLQDVTVVGADRQNYAVTGAELATLVAGGKPAAAAPAGFAFRDAPFLLTITNGQVVEVHQIWVP